MRYKGIIFDLDGVICHTDRYHYQAWKETADSAGVYFDETINERLRGVSRTESLDIILERAERTYSAAEKQALAEKKNGRYVELLRQMTPADLTEEVKETLDLLRQAGCKLAIGSSSRNTKLILERLGLSDFFDAVSDGTNITHSKPHPEVFLKAAAYLGLDASDCLVVEDADAGIAAAAAGGFESAGIGQAAANPQTTYPLQTLGALYIKICNVR